MVNTVVYAIYHLDSGLYFTGKTLDELSESTKLYKSMSDAMIDIEGHIEYITPTFSVRHSSIINELVWDYLEKEKGTDRWHINIGEGEYNDIFDMMRRLKVVPVNLEHNQNV